MSGKSNKFKSMKKPKVKTPTSVKNVQKKRKFTFFESKFLDVLNEDVWEFMNSFDEKELK